MISMILTSCVIVAILFIAEQIYLKKLGVKSDKNNFDGSLKYCMSDAILNTLMVLTTVVLCLGCLVLLKDHIDHDKSNMLYDATNKECVSTYKLVPTCKDYYLCVLDESGKLQYTIENCGEIHTEYKQNAENCYFIKGKMNTLTKVKAIYSNKIYRLIFGEPSDGHVQYYFDVPNGSFKSLICRKEEI